MISLQKDFRVFRASIYPLKFLIRH